MDDKEPTEYISLRLPGKPVGQYPRLAYAKARRRLFRSQGFKTVTLKEVQAQIDAILMGKRFLRGLTIIGYHMQDEVVAPERFTRSRK